MVCAHKHDNILICDSKLFSSNVYNRKKSSMVLLSNLCINSRYDFYQQRETIKNRPLITLILAAYLGWCFAEGDWDLLEDHHIELLLDRGLDWTGFYCEKNSSSSIALLEINLLKIGRRTAETHTHHECPPGTEAQLQHLKTVLKQEILPTANMEIDAKGISKEWKGSKKIKVGFSFSEAHRQEFSANARQP